MDKQPSTPATIREIAKRAGVSIGSVSRSLNNRPGISEETRSLVLGVAKELGYDTRNLRLPAIERVAFLLQRFSGIPAADPFYSRVLSGAEAECRRHGLALSFGSVGAGEAAETIQRFGAGGILAVGYMSETQLAELRATGKPVVLVDHSSPSFVSVNVEQFNGALELCRYLIRKGHKRIAFIGGQKNHYSILERFRAYRVALEEAKLSFDEKLVAWADPPDPDKIAPLVETLLGGKKPPTAVFAFNDHTATITLGIAQTKGFRVPEDIAVAGFDDWETSAYTFPPLTTVHITREALGAEGVRVLLELERGNTPSHRILPVNLVVRRSTG